MQRKIPLGSLTIASGASESGVLDFTSPKARQSVEGLTIFAPAALTGTITVEVSGDDGSTYQTLQSAGSDVEVGAGDAVPVTFQGWDALRLASDGVEAADREFVIIGIETLE